MNHIQLAHQLTLPRSPHWEHLERDVIAKHPYCAASELEDHLQVHHITPFHIDPELELEPNNLIVLSAHPSGNFHLWLGHFGNWHRFNPDVVAQAAHWLKSIRAARK